VEIHHVDLDAGYQPGDWPADFVQVALARVARDFAGRADAPRLLACPEGQEAAFPIGPAGPGPASTVTVSGPPAALLAWLTGRDTGAGLEVAGADTVPVLPPWR
jgi:maleylpyruvate isomerase